MIQTNRMTKKFRNRAVEALEDRAVPSAMGATLHAKATSSPTIQQQLTAVDTQINSAYSTFAASIFQAEGALVASGGLGTPALSTSVGQAITTLQTSLTSAIHGIVNSSAVGVIQSQLTGSSAGSLVGGMEEILAAATAGTGNGSISPTSYPLLATAVNGEITSSYTSASVEAYLYATGVASGKSSNINLNLYASRANAAYGSFASTVFGAEAFLVPVSGSTPQASTALNVVAVVDSQIGGLVGSLGSLVSGTSVASRASVIQSQFIGSGSSSLVSRMNALFGAAASPDGSIPVASLPLLNAAVDAAISDSYTSTAVEGYLLATA